MVICISGGKIEVEGRIDISPIDWESFKGTFWLKMTNEKGESSGIELKTDVVFDWIERDDIIKEKKDIPKMSGYQCRIFHNNTSNIVKQTTFVTYWINMLSKLISVKNITCDEMSISVWFEPKVTDKKLESGYIITR